MADRQLYGWIFFIIVKVSCLAPGRLIQMMKVVVFVVEPMMIMVQLVQLVLAGPEPEPEPELVVAVV